MAAVVAGLLDGAGGVPRVLLQVLVLMLVRVLDRVAVLLEVGIGAAGIRYRRGCRGILLAMRGEVGVQGGLVA